MKLFKVEIAFIVFPLIKIFVFKQSESFFCYKNSLVWALLNQIV